MYVRKGKHETNTSVYVPPSPTGVAHLSHFAVRAMLRRRWVRKVKNKVRLQYQLCITCTTKQLPSFFVKSLCEVLPSRSITNKSLVADSFNSTSQAHRTRMSRCSGTPPTRASPTTIEGYTSANGPTHTRALLKIGLWLLSWTASVRLSITRLQSFQSMLMFPSS